MKEKKNNIAEESKKIIDNEIVENKIKEEKNSNDLKKNNKKLKICLIVIFSIITIIGVSFCLFGSVFLNMYYTNEDESNEVLVHNEYKKPKIKCRFFGGNVSDKNIKIIKDIDIDKIGKQVLEYECSSFLFKKNIEIEYNILDKEAPELKLNGDSSISIYVGDEYKENGANAIDNYDGDITDKIEIIGEVATDKVGTYEITYKITDSSNNESTALRKIEVKEKTVKKTSNQNNYVTNNVSANTSCGTPGTIYLTFDDGPNATYTPVILDVLKKYDVKATFFVTSSGPDELIKREYDEGHTVAIHTSSHVYSKIYSSDEAFWNDMNIVSGRIERITGVKPTLMRFPGGGSNTVSRNYSVGIMGRLAQQIEERGYAYFDWNISSGDAGGTTDPNVEYRNVVNNLSKSRGNVILMHDIKYHTSQAIDSIVKYGIDNGYTFSVLTKDVVCHQHINN